MLLVWKTTNVPIVPCGQSMRRTRNRSWASSGVGTSTSVRDGKPISSHFRPTSKRHCGRNISLRSIEPMKVEKKYLYLIAALIWGLPGILITIKGVKAYSIVPSSQIGGWLILTGLVIGMFHLISRRMVKRYSERIAGLPERNALWQAFPTRGWRIILFMMGLGIVLKLIPHVPIQFTVFFYSGLGPMLIVSAFRFLQRM